jgi:hypothetical protein
MCCRVQNFWKKYGRGQSVLRTNLIGAMDDVYSDKNDKMKRRHSDIIPLAEYDFYRFSAIVIF